MESHVIRLQSWGRGILARKAYVAKLVEKIQREQEEMDRKQSQQVQETLDMLDTMALQQKIQNESFLTHCERNRLDRAAYVIQWHVKFWIAKKNQLKHWEMRYLELQQRLQTASQQLIRQLVRRDQLKQHLEN